MSGIYWCPYCFNWHHTNLSLLGKGTMDHIFSDPQLIEVMRPDSIAKINEKLKIFIQEVKEKIDKQVIIYTSEKYDQEFLMSLIPSLREKNEN